jgi:hypothetical protein
VADVVLRDWRAAECDRDQEDDEDAARDRDLVAAEAAPDELPVASGLDLFDLAEVRAALDADGRAEAGAGGAARQAFMTVLAYGHVENIA